MTTRDQNIDSHIDPDGRIDPDRQIGLDPDRILIDDIADIDGDEPLGLGDVQSQRPTEASTGDLVEQQIEVPEDPEDRWRPQG